MTDRKGVYGKYQITKSDGSPINPLACYFVLRLDTDQDARAAMRLYARKVGRYNPRLEVDITKCLDAIEDVHGWGVGIWHHGGDPESTI